MFKLADKIIFKGIKAKNAVLNALKNERGDTNIVAIIVILAIVIALAIIFKDSIKALFDSIWGSIEDDVDSATGNYGGGNGI